MEIKKIEKTFDGLRLLVAIAISILFIMVVVYSSPGFNVTGESVGIVIEAI